MDHKVIVGKAIGRSMGKFNNCFIITLWIFHVIYYFFFKVKYLKNCFIDFDSVKSYKITNYKTQIMQIEIKQYFEIIWRPLILTNSTSGSKNWLLILLRRSIKNRSWSMKTQYSSWIFNNNNIYYTVACLQYHRDNRMPRVSLISHNWPAGVDRKEDRLSDGASISHYHISQSDYFSYLFVYSLEGGNDLLL